MLAARLRQPLQQAQHAICHKAIDEVSHQPTRMRLPGVLARTGREPRGCIDDLVLYQEQPKPKESTSSNPQHRGTIVECTVERTRPDPE
jgi:hypothetical protein